MENLDPISIVIVGHVDHGKSTFIGRFLYDTKNVSEDRIEDVKKISKDLGRKMEFAFVMDSFQEEREQNITIDTSQTFFKLGEQPYILIDAPGHKEYLKNMITGATQAQHAIIMLDINEGVREQTGRHAQILNLIGVSRVAVFINKMDLVGYKEDVYQAAEKEIRALLRERGLNPEAIVPMAAYHGDNVTTRSDKMPWYKGPTALDFIQSRTRIESDARAGSLVCPIQLTYQADGERLVLGRIERGVLQAGSEVEIFPLGVKTRVKKILKYKDTPVTAEAGECVGLVLETDQPVARGQVLCASSDKGKASTGKLEVQLFWAAEHPVKVGDKVAVENHTQSALCRIDDLSDLLTDEKMGEVKLGDIARVRLSVENPILLDSDSGSVLSRLVFHHGNQVAGCGIVTNIAPGVN